MEKIKNLRVDPNPEDIEDFLTKDILDRNRFIEALINIILNSDDGIILDLNGAWGSGKTVIARELEEIIQNKDCIVKNAEKSLIQSFRSDYEVFYYNAWENDQYDPSESVIFQLISKYWDTKEKISDTVLGAARVFMSELIRIKSHELLDVSKINDNKYTKGMFDEITNLNERRKKAGDVISAVLSEKRKKHLLFIVDELDRCNPVFAVRLIEVMKHYFTNEKTKLLFITNNTELASIIEKYYGEKFSGYNYLDKIFDLVIDIPQPDRKKFVDATNDTMAEWCRDAIIGMADYYDMSLREIKRYCVLMRISRQYLDFVQSNRIPKGDPLVLFARSLLLPAILAAKIKSLNDFSALVNWGPEGQAVIQKIEEGIKYAQSLISDYNLGSMSKAYTANRLYQELLTNTGRTAERQVVKDIRKVVAEMVSLINIMPQSIKIS